MQTERNRPSFSISFFGAVGAVMAALKLKERWDGYKSVSNDEGRLSLASPAYRDVDGGEEEEGVSLLDTALPSHRPKRVRAKGCCLCCGLDCTLFCKALGIVTAVFLLWYGLKFVIWAVKPSPTGLEKMPSFNTSLGCLDAPYSFSETFVSVPWDDAKLDHAFDISGDAVGTFTVAPGDESMTEVEYKISIRSNDRSLLDQTALQYPTDAVNSRLVVYTPGIESSSTSCIRYDIRISIPPSLKKVHIASHSAAMQVAFTGQLSTLDDFGVTLYRMSDLNMILPTQTFSSTRMKLEVYRGWIVGEVGIIESTSVATQRGDGVTNVRVYPKAPEDPVNPEPVVFETVTGAGRTDVVFLSDKTFAHRTISSKHVSSRNADVYLTYRDAEFSGLVELKSTSYSSRGLQPYAPSADDSIKWTHWVGSKDGEDRIQVNSRGWTGLYM
ncbi:hypothetical protein C8J56DRAFT_855302 [Mycena floridula]|nr:hypothetical protein C8J56DRAFT_855302 [Mycena floridula]